MNTHQPNTITPETMLNAVQPKNKLYVGRKPIRTKVIVLGSSGAGKTSFIRRYFHKTFHDERRSTKCADYYSTIMPNPLAIAETETETGQNQNAISSEITVTSKKSIKKKKNIATTIVSEEVDHIADETESRRSCKSTKSKKHKKKKHKKKKCSTESKIENVSELSKADNVTGPLKNQLETNILTNKYVALQMWDTAGKERLLTESAGLTSRLGDSFFRHANVALLIYDATSSRSFLQLIKWYSELLERISRVQTDQGYGYENEAAYEPSSDKYAKANGRLHTISPASNGSPDLNRRSMKRRFPVLVIASKLDKLKEEQSKSGKRRTVPQREVMGFKSGFKGMDYHYEYTVFNGTDIQQRGNDDEGHSNLKSSTTSSTDNVAKKSSERMSLSYSLEGGSWAKDKAYMDYVRMAEDACFPDREMVKRWCRRNGLQHIEVSALEDMGVNQAVEAVVSLGLREMIEQEKYDKKIQDDVVRSRSMQNVGLINSRNDTASSKGDDCQFCSFLLPKMFSSKDYVIV